MSNIHTLWLGLQTILEKTTGEESLELIEEVFDTLIDSGYIPSTVKQELTEYFRKQNLVDVEDFIK